MDQFQNDVNFFFKQIILSPAFDGNVLNAYFNAITLARSYSFLRSYLNRDNKNDES